MKDPKRLVQELKREYKYSDEIVADWVLEAEGKRQSITSGKVTPIRSDN